MYFYVALCRLLPFGETGFGPTPVYLVMKIMIWILYKKSWIPVLEKILEGWLLQACERTLRKSLAGPHRDVVEHASISERLENRIREFSAL